MQLESADIGGRWETLNKNLRLGLEPGSRRRTEKRDLSYTPLEKTLAKAE